MSFVHLHCHTEYSLLDGAIRINDLTKKASSLGMPAAAITDHGNMHGAAYFYMSCKDHGIIPILGCEVYVTHDHRDCTSELAKKRHHLILLAQNKQGYQNLIELVSRSFLDGYYYKPRVDKGLLKKYSDGIIALSACIAGEIPRTLLGNNAFIQGGGTFKDAIAIANEYAAMYPGRFYLEVQSNTLPEQNMVNNRIYELAHETKLPLVATNDCHYLNSEDVEAHDILLCVQQQRTEFDENRWKFDAKDLYYKTPEEMTASFKDYPEAIENTLKIADECKGLEIQLKTPPYHFPIYELPEGMTLETEFRKLAREGLEKRIEKHPKRDSLDIQLYKDRLEMELDVICGMGFPGYFLIVQDFINWAKNKGIPVGPGRGSAAGSLVAWSLRITNLDPIPYNLFFERFLNVERVSMPDIDVDFCEDRRLEVVDYVSNKYGKDKVAQIATFGKMKAKAVIRDVGRAIGLSFQDTSRICKILGDDLGITLEKALASNREFKEEYEKNASSKRLIDICLRLEGLSRHASTHAAGVVVSDKPMYEYLPIFKGKKDELVTQFDMKIVEKVGLVKFDFLGLRTITLINKAIKNIVRQGKTAPDLDTLPFDDPQIYDLYAKGDTDGVFQVESTGMRKYLRMLRPTCFEDLIAMLALYRPGPLNSGMVDEFCKRKHGEVEVTYPLPELEKCLKDTYGVIVYQEQVMQIAQIVAQYTLGGADLLRRAMGKKKPEEMAQQRGIFLDGSGKRGVPEDKANEIFDLMEKFAEYGFNKAHSAAYAVISYHTAYLKKYFPVEFMSALLSSEIGNQDKILKYVAVCNEMNIKVKAPDIQKSRREFTPDNDAIIYGLGGVKTVGDEAINEIVRNREENGPYKSFYDFCCRINLRKVTKRVLENLIKAGALDCFGVSRNGLLAIMDTVIAKVAKKQKEKESKQVSLLMFAPVDDDSSLGGVGFECPENRLPEWTEEEKINYEKEALGFYLTSHPLQAYMADFERLGVIPLEDVRNIENKSLVNVAVLVTGIKEIITKTGKKMAFMQIEDLTGHAELIIFPKKYEELKQYFSDDSKNLFFLSATVDKNQVEENNYDENKEEEEEAKVEIKLLAENMIPLLEACENCSKEITIDFGSKPITNNISLFKQILQKHKGNAPFSIYMKVDEEYVCKLQFSEEWKVKVTPEFYRDMRTLCEIEQ